MEALDILKSARERIAKAEHWGKGLRAVDRPLGTCCAAEAIEESDMPCSDGRVPAYRALLHAAGPPDDVRITEWNDAPERTHAEVIAAFNLAIATLKL